MFDSKFMIFLIGILIVCIALVSYVALSDNIADSDSNLNENSDDITYIGWKMKMEM